MAQPWGMSNNDEQPRQGRHRQSLRHTAFNWDARSIDAARAMCIRVLVAAKASEAAIFAS
jgi:hypothetical protein